MTHTGLNSEKGRRQTNNLIVKLETFRRFLLETFQRFLTEFIQSIKDNPVLIGDLDIIEEVQKKRDLLIREADYSDFFHACDGNKNLENAFTLLREERSTRVRKTPILAEPVLAEPDYAVIVAELDASDEQIESDFSKWLKNYRKTTKYESREKMFKLTDFKKWASNKVLPYIDLTMIAKAEGKRLTQKKLGDLLFPEVT